MIFRKISLSVIVAVALLSAPAAAQGFFDRGKEMLKGFGGGTESSGTASLGTDEIAKGLKEALRIGSERVVGTLGTADGFNKSPDIRIPLPDSLKSVQSMLSKVGMGALGEDLELRLNRAAEAAVPKAKALFGNAIAEMSIEDARKILNGPKDSATQYFRSKMSAPLAGEMKPIVDQ